jgi:hypothetical protein
MQLSERVYEALKTFKGKKLDAAYKTKDGVFVACNSKKFNLSKVDNVVTLNFHKLTQISIDLDRIELYSLAYNADEQCEKFIVMTKDDSELEISLEIEGKYQLTLESTDEEYIYEYELDHVEPITNNKKIKL